MESRLRKLIGITRDRSSSSYSYRDRQDTSHASVSSQGQVSVSSRHSLTRRSVTEDRRDSRDSHGLQSVPYEKTASGRAPVFVSKPVKGNGPVKLQASRRMSSGELLATARDSEQTLEDIREGEYIVGGKSKRDSSTRSFRSPTPQCVSADMASSKHASPKYSPRPPSTAGKPSITVNTDTGKTAHSAGLSECGLGISTPSGIWGSSSPVQSHRDSPATSPLYKSYEPDISRLSASPTEEQNATIAALWKAEYSRLVRIYGHDGAQRNIARLNAIKDRPLPPSPSPLLKEHGSRVSIVLEPLPHPVRDRENSETRKSSDTSVASALYHEDDSDVSSNNRASLISSCAGSSAHTTNTTMTDQDAIVTKEDIRKIVEEMRATYLRAFESNTPSSPKIGRSTKKKRRTKVGSTAPNSQVEATATRPDRQTWHGHDETATSQKSVQRKHRLTSPSASAFGRLSPVEDSPTRQDSRPRPRLQRADSTTLGSIEAMLTDDLNSRAETRDRADRTAITPETSSVRDDPSQLRTSLMDAKSVRRRQMAPSTAPSARQHNFF